MFSFHSKFWPHHKLKPNKLKRNWICFIWQVNASGIHKQCLLGWVANTPTHSQPATHTHTGLICNRDDKYLLVFKNVDLRKAKYLFAPVCQTNKKKYTNLYKIIYIYIYINCQCSWNLLLSKTLCLTLAKNKTLSALVLWQNVMIKGRVLNATCITAVGRNPSAACRVLLFLLKASWQGRGPMEKKALVHQVHLRNSRISVNNKRFFA